MEPKRFEIAISRLPRIRACRFSSATPVLPPPNVPRRASTWAANTSPISSTSSRIPSPVATCLASSRLSDEETWDGIASARTAPAPSASTARTATNVESIPPDRPSTTCSKPFLRT
jgi:hypothetical protein